jgi:TPR repeat protein
MDHQTDADSVYDKGAEDADGQTGQNSYIYAKYSLPRGRMVDRDSLPLEALMPKIDFDSAGAPGAEQQAEPLSPPPSMGLLAEPLPRTSTESLPAGRGSSIPLTDDASAAGPSRPAPHAAARDLRDQHRHSMTSMDTSHTGNSGSTIKASKHNRQTQGADMSAEEHLQKGIECHERGSLKESTYHLRLAARQNNPTAMLLFALACRHGWGMRQSAQEGIAWLRKAIDCANIEMSEGGTTTSEVAREKRAQFALGVYELGVSHMNGWGVEHDKVLALRCFEIAAAWGDADAMAEAGFCYYQAVGCKKDLRKAARYYRQAEAKGMSMVGNSW